jgi:hypothetical protein
MQFEIPIEEARGKRSYIISLHLVVCFLLIITGIFEFLLFVFFSKSAADQFHYFHLLKWGGPVTTLLGLTLLGFLIFKNKWLNEVRINRGVRIVELIIFTGFTFIAWQLKVVYPAAMFGIIAVCLLLALFWETKTGERNVVISENGILIPKASGGELLKWYEVQNVIHRFGIITIDCIDNRLLQWNTKKSALDEELLYEFCKAKIAAGLKDRGKVW